MKTEDLLNQREEIYGDFGTLAEAIQAFKSVYRAAPSWSRLTAIQREVMDQDIVKNCRILYGDPMHLDNWVDKAGYSTLGTEEFAKPEVMVPAASPKDPMELLNTIVFNLKAAAE